MLGIGLLGTGLHGSRYASHLAKGEVSGMKLVACSRRDRLLGEQKARELGCRFRASTEELVHDPDVQAVLVVTPAAHHAEAVLAAVRARKPVLVEKPLTHSLAEARELLRAVKEQRGRVMVAQTLRWEPVYARAVAVAKAVGPLNAVSALFVKGDFTKRETSDSRATDCHRAVWSCGIHHLDWAGLVFPGGFTRAFAYEAPGEEGLSFTSVLEARTGGSFSLTVRLKGDGLADGFTMVGDRGALAGNRPAHTLRRFGSDEDVVDLGPRIPTLPHVLASFRDYVNGEKPNPVPLEEAVRAVARAEACVRSIALRAPVVVEEEI